VVTLRGSAFEHIHPAITVEAQEGDYEYIDELDEDVDCEEGSAEVETLDPTYGTTQPIGYSNKLDNDDFVFEIITKSPSTPVHGDVSGNGSTTNVDGVGNINSSQEKSKDDSGSDFPDKADNSTSADSATGSSNDSDLEGSATDGSGSGSDVTWNSTDVQRETGMANNASVSRTTSNDTEFYFEGNATAVDGSGDGDVDDGDTEESGSGIHDLETANGVDYNASVHGATRVRRRRSIKTGHNGSTIHSAGCVVSEMKVKWQARMENTLSHDDEEQLSEFGPVVDRVG